MLTPEDIDNLATLSRLALTEEEKASLGKDLESILGYVSELQTAPTDAAASAGQDLGLVKNVMREDGEPHEPGQFTEVILNEAPKRKGDYIAVKQILGGSDVA